MRVTAIQLEIRDESKAAMLARVLHPLEPAGQEVLTADIDPVAVRAARAEFSALGDRVFKQGAF